MSIKNEGKVLPIFDAMGNRNPIVVVTGQNMSRVRDLFGNVPAVFSTFQPTTYDWSLEQSNSIFERLRMKAGDDPFAHDLLMDWFGGLAICQTHNERVLYSKSPDEIAPRYQYQLWRSLTEIMAERKTTLIVPSWSAEMCQSAAMQNCLYIVE